MVPLLAKVGEPIGIITLVGGPARSMGAWGLCLCGKHACSLLCSGLGVSHLHVITETGINVDKLQDVIDDIT